MAVLALNLGKRVTRGNVILYLKKGVLMGVTPNNPTPVKNLVLDSADITATNWRIVDD